MKVFVECNDFLFAFRGVEVFHISTGLPGALEGRPAVPGEELVI